MIAWVHQVSTIDETSWKYQPWQPRWFQNRTWCEDMISPKITIMLFNKDIQSILQKYKNKIILYSCIQLFHLYIHEKLWFRLLMFCVQEISGNHLSALQQIHIKIRKRQLAQLTNKNFRIRQAAVDTSQQIEHQDYSNGAANGRPPFFVWLEFA